MSVVFEEDFSGKTKKYILKEFDKKVSKSGDQMTGDLDMQTNFIHSTAIPNDDSDLMNKKYVDDTDNRKLNLSGGNMTGDVNMQGNKLTNLKDPMDPKDSTHRKYVDDADNLRLSISGGRMTGDLDMGNHIIHALNYSPLSNQHSVNRKYLVNWSWPNTVSNLYLLEMDDEGIFETRDDTSNITYAGSSKKISQLLNLGRKENWNLEQGDDNKKPLFKKSTVNNKFWCLQYLGSNSSNLHLSSTINLLQSHLNVFIVYALKSKNSLQNELSLFKINDKEI